MPNPGQVPAGAPIPAQTEWHKIVTVMEQAIAGLPAKSLPGVIGSIASVIQSAVKPADPVQGKETQRITILTAAFNKQDKKTLTDWINDQPPHPHESNVLAQWYLDKLNAIGE
jgi:hypothetical protein